MLLHIHDRLKVADVQERFAKCFPDLKIEFYSRAHHPHQVSRSSDLIDPENLIGDIRKNHRNGDIDIKSWMTIGKVEEKFKEEFGLNVQVLRRSPGGWEQTEKSDEEPLYRGT